MSEPEWIVQRDGNRYPAADVATLQHWATSGNIRPDDQVWSPARGDWSTATEVPEIAELIVRPTAIIAGDRAAVGAVSSTQLARASNGARAVAYLIDVIPAVMIALIALIPLIGHIIAGVLLGFYWLYRDAMRFSLGKIALGLQVVQADGSPATRQSLIRRNMPLGIAGFVTAIPLLGLFLGPITGFVAVASAGLLLLSEGQTLGDKWAGTAVVKRG